MLNKIKFILSLLFVFISLLSCDKANINKENGQYAITFNYVGTQHLELLVYVDGQLSGSFFPAPNVVPSSTTECRDLKDPDKLTNVYVIKDVTKGEHTIELRSKSDELITTLQFEMLDRECVFQSFNLVKN
ncbi:hypothetical protein ACQKCH_04560 [Nubsella zeaxanthinifaciens]|uniref:hypothetical protein n=1 Tax=Nubsella zeaxanthinifaciens TaxID=392412 RepID=UPI003D043EB3